MGAVHTLLLRVAVRTHRAWLDRQLAEGRRPDSDPELALRARQLTSEGVRHRLASALLRCVDVAGRKPRRRSPAAPLDRRAVLEASALLIQLAQRLDAKDAVNPRGVAMVKQLITDGCGPLYAAGTPFMETRTRPRLWDELRAALVGLDRLQPSA
jgi:hypothetical protein